MDKELFMRIMRQLEENSESDAAICTLLDRLDPDDIHSAFIYSRNDATLYTVLESFYGEDIMDTIYYFTCDLEWGQQWKPGSMTDNGKDARLQTFEDLYNYCESKTK